MLILRIVGYYYMVDGVAHIESDLTKFALNIEIYMPFINIEHLYRELLRGAPDSSTDKKSSLKVRKDHR